jgi:hypothetical protein
VTCYKTEHGSLTPTTKLGGAGAGVGAGITWSELFKIALLVDHDAGDHDNVISETINTTRSLRARTARRHLSTGARGKISGRTWAGDLRAIIT